MCPPYILQEGLPVHIFFVPTVYLLEENIIMTTIYVRKQSGERDDSAVRNWFPIKNVERPATDDAMRELVADAAIADWEEENPKRTGEYTFKSNKVNLYVKDDDGTLVVLDDEDVYKQHAGKKKIYVYVPAPPTRTTEVKEGGGGDQGKLMCCGLFDCSFVGVCVSGSWSFVYILVFFFLCATSSSFDQFFSSAQSFYTSYRT